MSYLPPIKKDPKYRLTVKEFDKELTIGSLRKRFKKVPLDVAKSIIEQLPEDNMCLFYLLKTSEPMKRYLLEKELNKRLTKNIHCTHNWLQYHLDANMKTPEMIL